MFNFLFSRTEKDGVDINIEVDIDKEELKNETISSIVKKSRIEAEKNYKGHIKEKLKDELFKKYNIDTTSSITCTAIYYNEGLLVDCIIDDMMDKLGLIEDK